MACRDTTWASVFANECVWFDDNSVTSPDDDPPRNKYGRTKREAERLCIEAAMKGTKNVVILRAPRFFCEDTIESNELSLPNIMINELLGRRAALCDLITAHLKAMVDAESEEAATARARRG